LIQIEAQDALFTPGIYLRLQQALMAHVAERRVVIETLPSSNVRISQYERFEEHHVMRWMGVPGFVKPGDVPIMVSLGSDDPGIFSGNLKGEFYQLYAVLRKHGLLDSEALRHVAAVNERGRQYRFHDPAL
jgi:adenosine deaminase